MAIVDGDFEMSLKSKLKKRKAEQVDLVFCLDRPLVSELERARRENAEASQDRMVASKSAKVQELEKRYKEASVTVRLTSLPWGDWNALMAEHPARPGHDEKFNSGTFFVAAARASAQEVTGKGAVDIPDEDWDEFIEGLTDGEYDRLAGAVIQVNRNLATVDIAPLA